MITGRTGEWETVIGLEVHAQVVSKAKLFSGAATDFGAAPNSQVSPVDAAFPGMLPVINPSMGLTELLVARARSQKARPARVPILFIDALSLDSPGKDKVGAAPMAIDVTFLAADTVRLGNGTSTDQMRVIIGVDGRSRGAAAGTTATPCARSANHPLLPRGGTMPDRQSMRRGQQPATGPVPRFPGLGAGRLPGVRLG